MSERKVLNKYFPPDFDPAVLNKRIKRPGGPKQQVVRLMAPFSMRCNTCGEYIYKGKKFNARKETAAGETYFGIKVFRFYIKCTQCSAEITFKTDPKNADYLAEHGASRNFEPWRAADGTTGIEEETEEERLERMEREEAEDPMASLEIKQVDSKRDMDIMDKLSEIRSRNARLERADLEAALERIEARGDDYDGDEASLVRSAEDEKRKREEEEDEAEVRRVFAKINSGQQPSVPSIELDEELEPEDVDPLARPTTDKDDSASPVAGPSSATPPPKGPTVKRKLADVEPDALSLLSEDARKFVQSVSFGPKTTSALPLPLPKKKKENAMSNKLGIKLKPKKKPLV